MGFTVCKRVSLFNFRVQLVRWILSLSYFIYLETPALGLVRKLMRPENQGIGTITMYTMTYASVAALPWSVLNKTNTLSPGKQNLFLWISRTFARSARDCLFCLGHRCPSRRLINECTGLGDSLQGYIWTTTAATGTQLERLSRRYCLVTCLARTPRKALI